MLASLDMSTYHEPSFEELLSLCVHLGLVTSYEVKVTGLEMTCLGRHFDVDTDGAEHLMMGLLLGFYHQRHANDLTLAEWA